MKALFVLSTVLLVFVLAAAFRTPVLRGQTARVPYPYVTTFKKSTGKFLKHLRK